MLRLQAGMDHFAAARHDAGSDEGGRGAGTAATAVAADCGGTGGEEDDDQKQGKR